MVIKNTNYSKHEISRLINAGNSNKLTPSQQKLRNISNKIYLFDNITSEDVMRITKNVQFKRHKKGDVIMAEGDKGEEIYFILSGKGVVVVGKNKIVATIEAGNMLGEMAFLSKNPRSATILAHTDQTATISFEINEAKCNDIHAYPFAQLYKNMALDLAKKIDKANKK